jgi:DNA-binding NtrC family response regulator
MGTALTSSSAFQRAARQPLEVLVADANREALEELGGILRHEGHRVSTARDGLEALAKASARSVDLVVCDAHLPELDGLELLRRLRARSPATAVVLMASDSSVSEAVAAMKDDAVDYLAKPFDVVLFVKLVADVALERALLAQARRAREEPAVRVGPAGALLGRSPAMARLRERLVAFAPSDAAVLLMGESGTGKEVAARLLHELSPRCRGPFVAVNCAAFPDTLIEGELFGHVKGAFTGALGHRKGRLASAEGGTLFLDEVGELSQPAQAKLLRVLGEGMFTPLGSDEPARTDVRLVSATNRDLRAAVEAGTFRQDLFFRLKVLDATCPSLADRPGDLPLLVEHFLTAHASPGTPPRLSPAVWAALARHPFPGNVRELEHVVRYLVTVGAGAEELFLEHLPDELKGPAQPASLERSPSVERLSLAVDEFEREFIRRALAVEGGSRSRAAQRLGISRKCLWQKLKAHRLDGDEAKPAESGVLGETGQK